jgi:ceramide glucosyltransferase
MRARLRRAAENVALGAALASIGYAAFALHRLRRFAARTRTAHAGEHDAARPAVTIFKPAHGDEPGLEENLASFCAQDYPDFDVVFGALDPADPALAVMRRVAARYPGRASVVSGDGVARHRNPKMATLQPMIASARGDVLVIADSDMRVGQGYLDAIVAPFADPRLGALTCVFRGEPADGGLASVLSAMAITEQFMPSALVANALEPMTYCFGSTMAVRRDVFESIGGLAALGGRLADDYALGNLVAAHGYRIELASYVVTNVVSERGLRQLFAHELRWARTIRTVRQAGYRGIILSYPLALALLYAALARGRGRSLPVLALAALARLALHREAHRALGTPRPPSPLLIPLRDALGVAVWLAGLMGRDVRWRADSLRVTADGTLVPCAERNAQEITGQTGQGSCPPTTAEESRWL